jgi:PTH1 family peptidyl-tRNA hydrolase
MADDSVQIQLVVGLGNPGEEYKHTRHNAGFDAIDMFITKLPGKFEKTEGANAVVWCGRFKGRNLVLLKPMTFMNLSGKAVAMFAAMYDLTPESVMLVYDDVDLPLGRIRMRRNGGSGGHNGVESVISSLNSNNFARLRIGISQANAGQQVEHVLSKFTECEKTVFDKVLSTVAEALLLALSRGLDAAMNSYNSFDVANGDKNNEPAGN